MKTTEVKRKRVAQAHLSGVSKHAMIDEGESGLACLGHQSVWDIGSC